MPSSFAAQTFAKIENLIGKMFIAVAEKSMREGLLEEIELVSGMQYKEWIKTNNILVSLEATIWVGISAAQGIAMIP